jgi:hypothetical protein
MRDARSHLLLVPIVLVAGCLPSATPALPASFADRLQESGWAFEMGQQPTPDVISAADLVVQLDGIGPDLTPMLRTRADPVFGTLSCTGVVEPCVPGPYANLGDGPRPVWVVVYPDHAGTDGDVGWVMIDAVGRLSGGYFVHDPLDADLE